MTDRWTYLTLDDPQASPASSLGTFAEDINDTGQITGYYYAPFGLVTRGFGFVYDGATYASFAVPGANGGQGTQAYGINGSGQITGYYENFYRMGFDGFLDSGGTFTAIHDPSDPGLPFAPQTEPLGINDAGEIVGSYYDGSSNNGSGTHGFLYSGGVYSNVDSPSALFGTVATGINNSGQIVGHFRDDAGDHGFLDDAGTFTTLDDPLATGGTFANDINDSGQIVGYYVDGGGNHGFVYSDGAYTTIDDPNASGGTEVNGINNLGEIVGMFVDAAGHHGFEARLTTPTATNNFNGDNFSDILWQNDNGTAGVWLMSSDGVTPMQEQGVGMNPGADWHIKAAADFNGDGRSDILWQNDNGTAGVWLMGANGFTPAAEIGVGTNPGATFHVKAAADFDGDGRADILWQDDNGQAGVWLMGNDGVTPKAEQAVGANPGADWHIKAAADFDGNGHADILWQNDNGQAAIWLMGNDGVTPKAEVNVGANPGPNFHIVGAADFNGDGHADILWQDDAGQAGVWLMSADGVTPAVQAAVGVNPGPTFHVVGAADFNGDGHADILWQDNSGQAGVWLMGADGVTPVQESAVGANPGSSWHIVDLFA